MQTKMKYVLVHDDLLLEKARRIFGENLVEDAFFATEKYEWESEKPTKYGWESEDHAKQRLDFCRQQSIGTLTNQLDIDACLYFFKMSSGNMVSISTSEWGAICVHQDSNEIVITRESK